MTTQGEQVAAATAEAVVGAAEVAAATVDAVVANADAAIAVAQEQAAQAAALAQQLTEAALDGERGRMIAACAEGLAQCQSAIEELRASQTALVSSSQAEFQEVKALLGTLTAVASSIPAASPEPLTAVVTETPTGTTIVEPGSAEQTPESPAALDQPAKRRHRWI